MFGFGRKRIGKLSSDKVVAAAAVAGGAAGKALHTAVAVALEPLEDRRLFAGDFGWGASGFGGGSGGHHGGHGSGGGGGSTITFNLAPTAVQSGLDTLATADGLSDPASTATVRLGNSNGVETYSVTLTGTGTVSTLTVDQLGDAVTAPTFTTTTWATLSGTGTGSDSAAATEITSIATALSLTAPASTDTVNVTTTSTGSVTYSIHLNSSSASTTTATTNWGGGWAGNFGQIITVDAAGDPVGNQQLPFSVFSTTIQNALNKNAPTGATALASTSTQNVDVQTTDGVTTYSTTFTASGTQTTVTVNAAGTLTSLPSTTTTTFSALSSSLQTELQTLATADGVTTSIAATQTVDKLTETNGTVIYSVTLPATANTSGGSTYTFNVTVSVDSNGNPTTLPNNGFGFGDQGFGDGGFGGTGSNGRGDHGRFGDGQGGDCGTGSNASTGATSNSSSGSTTNASSGSVTLNSGGSASTANQVATASSTTSAIGALSAKLLESALPGLGNAASDLVEFAPSLSVSIEADLLSIATAVGKESTDVKSLSSAQKQTLKTDEAAIASAIKAVPLSTLEKTLKTDAGKYAALLKADEKTISKDKKNATALAAAQAKLATDKSAATAAIVADVQAIETAVTSASGVTAAQSKLATDLPTIYSDQSAVTSDVSQLLSDL